MKAVKNILFVIVMLVMVLPAVQKEWPLVKEPPLNGDFAENKLPEFSWKAIYTGSYQEGFEAYLEQHIGFHNTLVRLRNQLDYSMFRKPNAEGIVIGREGFIFEYDYIRELTGRDYMGYDFIDEKLRRLQYVQQYLKKEKGVELVLVFMPGKASFYKEKIPEKYLKKEVDSTNYTVYRNEMIKRGIRYIDLNDYFHRMKDVTPYPMFPKYGTHWSIYGMSRAAHVWIDSIERFTGKRLNDFNTDSLYFSTDPLRTDYDGGKTLNLLLNLSKEKFAYPYYVFGNDSSRFKPRVLVIGDSFYWNIFNAGIPKHLFANESFWYYNRKVYPDFYVHPKYTSELNLKEEVEKSDLIFIMVTERFLNIFDWQFVDQLYYLYTPDYIQMPVYDYMTKSVLDNDWFNSMIKQALAEQTSLANALYENAKYMLYTQHRDEYLLRFGLESLKRNLAKTDRAKILREVEEKNISFEESLENNAMYLFWKRYPEIYDRYKKIKAAEAEIRNNPALMDSITRLADKYYCKPDDMIFFRARKMVAL